MVTEKFTVNGVPYVVVREENAAHIMSETDWKKCYGRLHPGRWKKYLLNS